MKLISNVVHSIFHGAKLLKCCDKNHTKLTIFLVYEIVDVDRSGLKIIRPRQPDSSELLELQLIHMATR